MYFVCLIFQNSIVTQPYKWFPFHTFLCNNENLVKRDVFDECLYLNLHILLKSTGINYPVFHILLNNTLFDYIDFDLAVGYGIFFWWKNRRLIQKNFTSFYWNILHRTEHIQKPSNNSNTFHTLGTNQHSTKIIFHMSFNKE